VKILVTGGAGFIGSHMVDALIEEGHQVVVIDNLATGYERNLNPKAHFYKLDIRSPELAEVCARERPEVVNHHAAQTMVRISTEDPFYDADVNVRGLLNLLDNCLKVGVQKIVFASSGGTVYGSQAELPIREEQPFAPESPYGITKVASEYYLRYFAHNFGLKYTILRYANVYGPRDHVSSEHVITVFSEQLLRDERPTIHWDGEQAKDYVYIDDAVRANLLVMNGGDNLAYNIGSGAPLSVNSIYAHLSRLIGSDVEPAHGPKRLGDVRLFYLDCSKARRELDWEPRIGLEEGLSRTVAYYRQMMNNPHD
jgi:UDP-glucose 4-epimerase